MPIGRAMVCPQMGRLLIPALTKSFLYFLFNVHSYTWSFIRSRKSVVHVYCPTFGLARISGWSPLTQQWVLYSPYQVETCPDIECHILSPEAWPSTGTDPHGITARSSLDPLVISWVLAYHCWIKEPMIVISYVLGFDCRVLGFGSSYQAVRQSTPPWIWSSVLCKRLGPQTVVTEQHADTCDSHSKNKFMNANYI
jgi:hypothetical protein